jgi:Undecaprenyl-phosphate glucose phosphotransferase
MNEGAVYGNAGQDAARGRNAANTDWTQFYFQDGAKFRDFANDNRPMPLFLLWIVRLTDGAAVLAATLLLAVIEARAVAHAQAVANSVSDMVAVLFFFATSHAPRPSPPGFGRMIRQQMQTRAVSLLLAGMLQSVILCFLGAGEALSAGHALLWVAVCGCGLLISRAGCGTVLAHPAVSERMTRKYAIIGTDKHAYVLEERLAKTGTGIEVVGIFDDALAKRSCLADLIGLTHETKLQGIIIALPPDADSARLARVSQMLRAAMTDVFAMPYLMHGAEIALPMQTVGSVPVMVLQRRPLDEWQTVRKRALDMVLSLFAFIVFLPLFAVVAIAIKLDSPGPVLFRQPRRGFNNRQFTVFKFRSMFVGSSDLLASRQTCRGDERVTRVGKWLRRLSIDELPQLLNVLRGEMSLVGPRPHAPHTSVEGKLLNDAIGDYVLRYRVKPGITGWAQVNGARGELVTTEDLRRRLAFDFEYIQRWSIGFDLKIMALTAMREILSRNAF